MKLSLIEIVQEIMNTINGDFVNSISDTDEALEVAMGVRSTFYELFNLKKWPHSKTVGQLQSVNDNLYPTHLKLPDRLYHLDTLNYDKTPKDDSRVVIERVRYIKPEEFLRKTNTYNVENDNVDLVSTLNGNAKIKVMNDRAPDYYTTFDDEYLVFNSYDSEVETTLQGFKAQTIYFETPDFKLEDGFIPDLPESAFPYFMAEAKSVASVHVRQVEDAKSEQQSRRQSVKASQRNRRAASGTRYPNYGRTGGKTSGYRGTTKTDYWGTYDGGP